MHISVSISAACDKPVNRQRRRSLSTHGRAKSIVGRALHGNPAVHINAPRYDSRGGAATSNTFVVHRVVVSRGHGSASYFILFFQIH